MGELADALRDPSQREILYRYGGTYSYDNPVGMVGDMAALKRAFPDVRLLCDDNYLHNDIGYLGYRTDGDREVLYYFRLPFSIFHEWELDLRVDELSRRALAQIFRLGEGRRRLIRIAESLATTAAPATAAPATEDLGRRSIWARLKDEPL